MPIVEVRELTVVPWESFDKSDFDSGLRRVVLCRSLARQLFGREAVSGEIVRLNEVDYTVCGVVADVSGAFPDVYAQAWLPYSSMSLFMDESKGEDKVSVGDLQANILLRDKHDLRLEHFANPGSDGGDRDSPGFWCAAGHVVQTDREE